MHVFLVLVLAALVIPAGVIGSPAPSVTGIIPDNGVSGSAITTPEMVGGMVVVPSADPVLSSVSPSIGIRGSTIGVFVVRGSGFARTARLKLNRTGSADVPIKITSRSSTRIRGSLHVPMTVGFWNVQVTQTGSSPAVKSDAFQVLYPGPVITAVSPIGGIQGKTISPLSIRGSGFRAGANASFVRSGMTPVPITITGIAANKLTGDVTLPEIMAAGPWKVRVTQPDGMPGSKAGAFTVIQNGTPNISITGLNLAEQYLLLTNNWVNPVVMTGYKIKNGEGDSITFIKYPQGGGTYYDFVLKPLTTVTIYYAKDGVPTDTELYFNDPGMWTRPGDVARLFNPQGKMVSRYVV